MAAILSLLVIGAFLIPEGEVVTLQTLDAAGNQHATQLWIAEVDGSTYVRAVSVDAAWLERIRRQPEAELLRSHGALDAPEPVRAVIVDDDEVEGRLDAAMAEKYGLSNSVVCAVLDAKVAVAIRLDPRSAAAAAASRAPKP